MRAKRNTNSEAKWLDLIKSALGERGEIDKLLEMRAGFAAKALFVACKVYDEIQNSDVILWEDCPSGKKPKRNPALQDWPNISKEARGHLTDIGLTFADLASSEKAKKDSGLKSFVDKINSIK